MSYHMQLMLGLQLLIALLIVYDANTRREWMSRAQLFVSLLFVFIVPLIGALLYLYFVTKGEEGRIECPGCGNKIDSSREMCPECATRRAEAAERSKEDDEDHTCDACGEVFDTRRGLMQHRASSHSDRTEDRSRKGRTGAHRCPECGKAFDSERGLHVHQGLKHKDETTSGDEED